MPRSIISAPSVRIIAINVKPFEYTIWPEPSVAPGGTSSSPVAHAWCRHGHHIAVAGRVLLNDDGVGAVGDHAAGKDARRLTLADGARERPSGRDLADDGEPGRGLRDVFGPRRVAVHRRHRRRRLCPARRKVGREHAPECVGERHGDDGQGRGSG
jgi:hypothetical protein